MPSWTVIGVFGIARTTGTRSLRCFSISAVGIAAAIETTVCSAVTVPEMSPSSVSMSCGFTPMTTIPAPSTASALAVVVRIPWRPRALPGARDGAPSRRSARLAPAGREHAGDQRLACLAGAEHRERANRFPPWAGTLPRRVRRYITASTYSFLFDRLVGAVAVVARPPSRGGACRRATRSSRCRPAEGRPCPRRPGCQSLPGPARMMSLPFRADRVVSAQPADDVRDGVPPSMSTPDVPVMVHGRFRFGVRPDAR